MQSAMEADQLTGPSEAKLLKLLGRARKEPEEVVRVGENGGMEARFLAACVWHVL